MSPATLLFDLDGTLLDTLGDLSSSLHALRASLGLASLQDTLDADPEGTDFVRRGIGNGLDALLRHGLRDLVGVDLDCEAQLAPIRRQWRDIYAQNLCVHTRPYPAVEDGLRSLKERAHPLAIVSNKPERFCLELVEQFGWQDFFPVVIGADSASAKKPDPAPILLACERLERSPHQAWMMGDSPSDIVCAARAECAERVACPWGYRAREDLVAASPTLLVESFEELLVALSCRSGS